MILRWADRFLMGDGVARPLPPAPLYVVAYYDAIPTVTIAAVYDRAEALTVHRAIKDLGAARVDIETRPVPRDGRVYKVFVQPHPLN